MKTLGGCQPRASVFDRSRRDVVLDLTDLIEKRIDGREFFSENYLTDGMKRLLREAFRRFQGQSGAGVIRLTQAMGGGKTHNMIALGLLAGDPELRRQVMEDFQVGAAVGHVRVVSFTGRESDAPYGIWGVIAEQIGKRELFKDYYSPLAAPGQTAWVNLLKGDPLLILLDELPPYLENAKSRSIGNSDLSVVTTTALSNLFIAVNRDELSNVCVVVSDLKATYQTGTQQINRAMQNLESEMGRVALNLEPVGLNTDEVYHILRKRLFTGLPDESEILDVARAYAHSLNDARQMDITNIPPDKFVQQVRETYPFHPAIRDLYARFRENPGFQQTRGLIRLMRLVVARLFNPESGKASRIHLIHPYDLDLNDREILAEVTSINPTLDNAISHDLASDGQSVAEILDAGQRGSDAQDACKLILVSSLANIPNAILGLSLSEIVGYLCAPGRDVSKLTEAIGLLSTKAWYLHASREGKLFFKNTQNLVAKLKSTADSYNDESSIKQLRDVIAKLFAPTQNDCYQDVFVFPAIDAIKVSPEKVSLVIYEPHVGGFHPDLSFHYQQLGFKNRVLYLSGQRETMDALLEVGKEHKAISYIIDKMDEENVQGNDPQRVAAGDLLAKINLRLLSASRETFNRLTYPHMDQLTDADFRMEFTNNDYRGEKQIRETLKTRQKFTEDVASDTFRKKCELRLFTQKVMPWAEVKKRAAINTTWQWHRTDALDCLKDDLVRKDQWRENGGYVEKGPFPAPETDVQIQEMKRDDNTGVVTLKLTPVHGDIILYEIDAPATTGSLPVEDIKGFQTGELMLSFLCVDSKGDHLTGQARSWHNRLTIKSRTYLVGADRMAELKSAPVAPIRYTTDGSNPKVTGGIYNGSFVVDRGTRFVLAVAEKNGITSDIHRLEIDWEKDGGVSIDPGNPAIWKREHSLSTTKEAYEFFSLLKKHNARLSGPRICIVGGQEWVELSVANNVLMDGQKVEHAADYLRGLLTDGQVSVEASSIHFPTGQNLLDWVAEVKTEFEDGEVEQG